MTNSKYRIGDFYFKEDEEPDRVDIKTTKTINTIDMPFSPYTMDMDYGHSSTSIVMQGYLSDFLEGSTGDYGFEKLRAEISEIGEKIIEVPNYDNTNNLRRYYGVPNDIKYTVSGDRPLIFDYSFSFVCGNPFSYKDGTISYATKDNISTTEASWSLGNGSIGPMYSEPVIILHNPSGGSDITKLELCDGSDLDTDPGNKIEVNGTLEDGHEWIIYPVKWSDEKRMYLVNTIWDRTSATITGDTTEAYTEYNESDSNIVLSGSIVGEFPRISSTNETFKIRVTGGSNTSDCLLQWRNCYG